MIRRPPRLFGSVGLLKIGDAIMNNMLSSGAGKNHPEELRLGAYGVLFGLFS